jgi:hypothetical protein
MTSTTQSYEFILREPLTVKSQSSADLSGRGFRFRKGKILNVKLVACGFYRGDAQPFGSPPDIKTNPVALVQQFDPR